MSHLEWHFVPGVSIGPFSLGAPVQSVAEYYREQGWPIAGSGLSAGSSATRLVMYVPQSRGLFLLHLDNSACISSITLYRNNGDGIRLFFEGVDVLHMSQYDVIRRFKAATGIGMGDLNCFPKHYAPLGVTLGLDEVPPDDFARSAVPTHRDSGPVTEEDRENGHMLKRVLRSNLELIEVAGRRLRSISMAQCL